MSRRITIKEVAAQARVSYQTVSKVLNGQAQVSKETEERIWRTVQQLGYRPNQIARSLRSQRSHLIGYSWESTPPDLLNPILDQFLQSMVSAAETAGYHLLNFPFRPGKDWLDVYRELIDTNRVDAFVLSSIDFNDPRIPLLQECNFPFVAFGRSNPDWDFPFVDIDGAAGMCQVVEHLVESGFERIAVLAWPEHSRVGQNRMDGIQAGLRAAGLELNQGWVAHGEGSYCFGLENTQRWLALPNRLQPDAIIAFTDVMAIGALQAVKLSERQVGVDVAVTGFDDMPLIQYLDPPLTSVRQPIWEVGQQVMSILLDLLDGSHAVEKHALVTPRLVVRASSLGRSGRWKLYRDSERNDE